MSWSEFLVGLFLAAFGFAMLGFREALYSLLSRLDPLQVMKDNHWFEMPVLVITALLVIVIGIGFIVAALVHLYFSLG